MKVVVLIGGRIGNQLFAIGEGLTIANQKSIECVASLPPNPHDMFMPHHILYKNTIFKHIKYITRDEICSDDIIVESYQRFSEKFLNRDIVLQNFKITSLYKDTIYNLYGDLSNVVSINIRRGDYIRNGYPVLSKEWVLKVMDMLFSKDQKYLITSDDLNWCKNTFAEYKNISYADKISELPKEILDLYIQTQCRDNIMSDSTFSWWGAYLNENESKRVIKWDNDIWFAWREQFEPKEKYIYIK